MTGREMVADDVSRETLARLDRFVEIFLKWNARINLVGKSTRSQIWERHIADSLQLVEIVEVGERWLDLGTGGGFPGLVVAIARDDCAVTLVDSDQRKCAFLSSAARQLDVQVRVIAERIDNVAPQATPILSARALAPMEQLVGHAFKHLGAGGRALFPKGKHHQEEFEAARQRWKFSWVTHESKTNPQAAIYEIWDIRDA